MRLASKRCSLRIFLSHAIHPDEGPIPSRLRAVATVYNMEIVLPDRTASQAERADAIQGCDVLVALATENAPNMDSLNVEVQLAEQLDVPVIALVEDGIDPEGIPHVVRFDRHNPQAHEQQLLAVLHQLQAGGQAPQGNNAALGWLAAITLGLVGLGGGDDEEDEDESW